ncbi:unnamed protein product [Danaus chrysippus]|uniref:(African queen) hypothetical protein n=1 Tax=Danaus chrysippus TaxID=151541 RepID=A0A8J2R322_9NEOP|nr:unnamed protein product [Danaus chrysippus]
MFLVLTILLTFISKSVTCEERNPYLEALSHKPWKSIQSYIEVRPGAFLFYWFYYADGSVKGAREKPLIIWIQGGPGLAASGIANFAEIGPLNMNMQPRNHTWVKGNNLLLIDHPVGTGFSYATNKSLYVRNDKGAARDLLRAIKEFFRRHKEFRKTPTYLIGQSYGGKLCPRLGYYLYTAMKNKRLKMNFKGIGIGSGWVDPKQSSLVQPEFLYNMGVIDLSTFVKSKRIVKQMCELIEAKEYATAGRFSTILFNMFNVEAAMDINFNNINQESPYPALYQLALKVNKYVKPTLKEVDQNLDWSFISDDVFESLSESFLVPSSKYLETLLNHTNLRIAVYNGNLDVVTPLAGATNWVHALKWRGSKELMNATRIPIKGHRNGFYKTARQLSLWSVFGSGHWVPEENPVAMEEILKYLMSAEYR